MNFQVEHCRGLVRLIHEGKTTCVINVGRVAFVNAQDKSVVIVFENINKTSTINLKSEEQAQLVVESIYCAMSC